MTDQKPDFKNLKIVDCEPPEPPKPGTLKEQLEAEIRADEMHRPAWSDRLSDGGDWLHLSREEAKVFDIDPARFSRLLKTFACYETFKLIADDPTWDEDFIAQARQAYPQWCDPAVYSVGEFQAFAKEFAGLTFREAFAMYNKQSFWCIRTGVTRFTDETRLESLRNFVHGE